MEPEQVATIDDEIAKPDPNPDLLPALPAGFALQEQTACHLLRAMIRAEAEIGSLEAKMKADMAAWAAEIAKAEARTESWRAAVLAWMVRNEITQLKTPWFTASLTKGRRNILVDDQDACIAIVKKMGANDAWGSKEYLVKKEFDIIFNSTPDKFAEKKHETTGDVTVPRIAHEEIGERTLTIRKK